MKGAASAVRQARHTSGLRTGLDAALQTAIDSAIRYLLSRQTSQGCWIGELEADSTLESDYVLLQLWLHQPDASGRWDPPSASRISAACRRIRDAQLEDGGWNIYRGGPSNVSASVKAYSALRLAGTDPKEPAMKRAARRIRELGGVQAANSYTKLYLSYFGLVPRHQVPSIPPEIFLLPANLRFGVYSMSAWSRAMLAPLSILDATKAHRRVPAGAGIDEIRAEREPPAPKLVSWKRFFLLADHGVKLLESTGVGRNRRRAIAAARDWMLGHLESSEGLGAIFPAMLNSIMALTELGYDPDHPLVRREIRHFEDLIIEDESGFRLQPCHSPVWDTGLTAFAIGQASDTHDEVVRWALRRAADWLIERQTRHPGDWSVRRPSLDPGGWFFEYSNEHYPDTDDTAKVLLALGVVRASDPGRQGRAEERGLQWLASMQSADGGWAAFDVDSGPSILTEVPFADHNAMLDPTCADITGRVLEALCQRGVGGHRDVVERGVAYLRRTQDSEGYWPGRWGVNHLYGTCFALRGLRAAAVQERDSAVLRAGEWVRSVQNFDGGWGESAASYEEGTGYVSADSTPSQTAWALMALFASGDYTSGSVTEGLDFLLSRQTPEGTWEERATTGTGFPRVFYLRYHMYPQYFPLIALGAYARHEAWE